MVQSPSQHREIKRRMERSLNPTQINDKTLTTAGTDFSLPWPFVVLCACKKNNHPRRDRASFKKRVCEARGPPCLAPMAFRDPQPQEVFHRHRSFGSREASPPTRTVRFYEDRWMVVVWDDRFVSIRPDYRQKSYWDSEWETERCVWNWKVIKSITKWTPQNNVQGVPALITVRQGYLTVDYSSLCLPLRSKLLGFSEVTLEANCTQIKNCYCFSPKDALSDPVSCLLSFETNFWSKSKKHKACFTGCQKENAQRFVLGRYPGSFREERTWRENETIQPNHWLFFHSGLPGCVLGLSEADWYAGSTGIDQVSFELFQEHIHWSMQSCFYCGFVWASISVSFWLHNSSGERDRWLVLILLVKRSGSKQLTKQVADAENRIPRTQPHPSRNRTLFSFQFCHLLDVLRLLMNLFHSLPEIPSMSWIFPDTTHRVKDMQVKFDSWHLLKHQDLLAIQVPNMITIHVETFSALNWNLVRFSRSCLHVFYRSPLFSKVDSSLWSIKQNERDCVKEFMHKVGYTKITPSPVANSFCWFVFAQVQLQFFFVATDHPQPGDGEFGRIQREWKEGAVRKRMSTREWIRGSIDWRNTALVFFLDNVNHFWVWCADRWFGSWVSLFVPNW